MTKGRYIDTKFWDDEYVIKLDPVEKLLFLYFLTNPLTNIAGIYEISKKRMSFDTGIDSDMITNILHRFAKDKKILRVGTWIIIKNFPQHQNWKSKDVVIGIKREFNSVPQEIQEEALKFGWSIDGVETVGGQSLDGATNLTKLNLTKPNLTNIASPVGSAPKFFTLIQKHFTSSYEKKFGSKPAVDFGKDGKVVNKSKGLFSSPEEAFRLIDWFLKSDKAKDTGYTLSICFSSHTINNWRASVKTGSALRVSNPQWNQ